jgi:hypothetical protein
MHYFLFVELLVLDWKIESEWLGYIQVKEVVTINW